MKPFWIGAVGSIIAVVTEWAFGDVGIVKWADDNWTIPLASMGTIFAMLALVGNL